VGLHSGRGDTANELVLESSSGGTTGKRGRGGEDHWPCYNSTGGSWMRSNGMDNDERQKKIRVLVRLSKCRIKMRLKRTVWKYSKWGE